MGGELGDLAQRSYSVEVGPAGRLAVEAVGRALQDLRLWRVGGELVDITPAKRIIEPQPGHSVGRLRLEGTSRRRGKPRGRRRAVLARTRALDRTARRGRTMARRRFRAWSCPRRRVARNGGRQRRMARRRLDGWRRRRPDHARRPRSYETWAQSRRRDARTRADRRRCGKTLRSPCRRSFRDAGKAWRAAVNSFRRIDAGAASHSCASRAAGAAIGTALARLARRLRQTLRVAQFAWRGGEVGLALGEGERATLPVPSAPSLPFFSAPSGKARVWRARSAFGQPALDAGRGFGAAPGAALALAGKDAPQAWNASGSEPLRLTVQAIDVDVTAHAGGASTAQQGRRLTSSRAKRAIVSSSPEAMRHSLARAAQSRAARRCRSTGAGT